MSQNSAAQLAKVECAVKHLLKLSALTVPQAMKLADFYKKDIADKTVQRAIRRRLPGGTKKNYQSTGERDDDDGR